MSAQYEAFHAGAPMRALVVRELRALAPILSRTFGNFGLLLSTQDNARRFLPEHKLSRIVELHPMCDGVLQGAARCSSVELPFVNDSFNVAIVQHAFEHDSVLENNVAELARVLAPEGLAIILGFNPLGTWRLWLELHRRRAGVPLCLRSAQAWQSLLSREHVDTIQIGFPGVWLPRGDVGDSHCEEPAARGAKFGSSWMLLARKRRSSLIPLRPHVRSRDVAVRPQLVPGAQRECA